MKTLHSWRQRALQKMGHFWKVHVRLVGNFKKFSNQITNQTLILWLKLLLIVSTGVYQGFNHKKNDILIRIYTFF